MGLSHDLLVSVKWDDARPGYKPDVFLRRAGRSTFSFWDLHLSIAASSVGQTKACMSYYRAKVFVAAKERRVAGSHGHTSSGKHYPLIWKVFPDVIQGHLASGEYKTQQFRFYLLCMVPFKCHSSLAKT